jgi:hypothetical protein
MDISLNWSNHANYILLNRELHKLYIDSKEQRCHPHDGPFALEV